MDIYNIFDEELGEAFDAFSELEYNNEFEFEDEVTNNYIKPQYINNYDYTLNSPLIADDIDGFIDYYRNIIDLPKHLRSNTWELKKKWLKKISCDPNKVLGSKSFHSFMTHTFKRKDISKKDIVDLVNQTNQDANETFIILESFMKSWIKRPFSYRERKNMNIESLKYGALMLDLHFIIIILNAVSKQEQNELIETFDLIESYKYKDIRCFLYRSEIFGKVHIGLHSVYFEEYNQLCDRNMVLLMKDTSLARFQTLMGMQFHHKLGYTKADLDSMIQLYYLGDCVVEEDAIEGYKAIGFIEAVTTHQLSELARKYRPLIPEFPQFPGHIQNTKEELEHIKSTIRFFQHIQNIKDKRLLLTMYGSFRHWGHPFIQYLEGLEKLYNNVNCEKKVDEDYADLLASNFAFKVLHHMFQKKKRWFVDKNQIPKDHIFYDHINNNTWPMNDLILKFGNNWNKLPLIKCWEIPDMIDQSQLYADKTHSIDRDELINHLLNHPDTPIPTKKVLTSLLSKPATNWPDFLKDINENGLDWKDLIIGLKPKERENKPYGRFFTLMSWKMREYFVITEYLIKVNIIPLFKGLTMADDQNTVLRKMLDCTKGQGEPNYNFITIANHIDFEKWNNHQTYEATAPVFKVMGQFHGYDRLFERTHQFFEKSLVYYKDRPDLLTYNKETGMVENKDPNKRVSWNGQKGGFEGIRQKGWTVLGYLVIEHESDIRNTNIKVLAQGDNQVMCMQYAIKPYKTEEELKQHIDNIVKNNNAIMTRIREGSKRLGLLINEDETLQSADMMIYGKNIIFRGNLCVLREKRLSRVSCVSNDQLPNYANILATLSTNCLTISHFSKSPIDPMVQYNWLGNFTRLILEKHNPAIRKSPIKVIKKEYQHILKTKEYKIAAIYLDPSLGGIGGTSFNRFLLRMFPDPVSESLSFWKKIHDNTDEDWLKKFCIKAGNPKLSQVSLSSFTKLLENPCSLNLPRGISAIHMIQNEIRKSLLESPSDIKNNIIAEALMYTKSNELTFLNYLKSIKPLFPRFLSEFKSSTFHGISEGIIGLFENSKTIRNTMSAKFRGRVDESIYKSEIKAIEIMISFAPVEKKKHNKSINKEWDNKRMWNCSSEQADNLRMISWGEQLVGTTVPHPIELINDFQLCNRKCVLCNLDGLAARKIIVIIPEGLKDTEDKTGSYPPYLGSNTKESTSVFQPWEKKTIIPIIKRAQEMLDVIGWFVLPDTPLSRGLIENIFSLTGVRQEQYRLLIAATGSGLHRYFCVRVSNGGFLASNPTYYTRVMVSSDDLALLGSTNYDFMHQSLMLYAQMTACNHLGESGVSGTYHFHLTGTCCIREITDPILNTPIEYKFPDMSELLNKWKPEGTEWFEDKSQLEIIPGKWDDLNVSSMSYHVGTMQGYLFSEIKNASYSQDMLNDLFPLSIKDKLVVRSFIRGVLMGISLSSISIMMERQGFYIKKHHKSMWKGIVTWMIDILANDKNFINLTKENRFTNEFITLPHHIPPSYPLTPRDQGQLVKNYMMKQYNDTFNIDNYKREFGPNHYIFSDLVDSDCTAPLAIAINMAAKLQKFKLTDDDIEDLKHWKAISMRFRNNQGSKEEISDLLNAGGLRYCSYQIRQAIKSKSLLQIEPLELSKKELIFGSEYSRNPIIKTVLKDTIYTSQMYVEVPTHQDPTISGLRIAQLATGSFLKLNEIISTLNIAGKDMMALGDGSGGIGASLLRHNLTGKLIFNSKIDSQDANLKGTLPAPPSAISQMDIVYKKRCINLYNSWEACTDLSRPETWEYFENLIKDHSLNIGLIVMDMEIRDHQTMNLIENLLIEFIHKNKMRMIDIVFKTYCDRIINKQSIIDKLSGSMNHTNIILPKISSSFTSEVYVHFKDFVKHDNRRMYPDKKDLSNWLQKNAYCFKTVEEEFARALAIRRYNTAEGVPKCFISDPYLDLESFMMRVGVHSGICIEFIAKLRSNENLDISLQMLISSLIMSGEAFMSTKKKYLKMPTITSDQKQLEWGSYYVGILIILSLLYENTALYKRSKDIIENGFFIYFKPTKQKDWRMNWSNYPIYSYNKMIRLNGCMSTIGYIIRIWHKIIKYDEGRIKRSNIIKIIEGGSYLSSNYGCPNLHNIIKYTGIVEDILKFSKN